MSKKLLYVVSLLIMASMVLAACAPTVTTQVITQVVRETSVVQQTAVVKETQIVEVTAVPVPTETPVPSTRKGAWVDQMVFTSLDDASAAVKQIQAGVIDIYDYTVADPAVFQTVKEDPKLSYTPRLAHIMRSPSTQPDLPSKMVVSIRSAITRSAKR